MMACRAANMPARSASGEIASSMKALLVSRAVSRSSSRMPYESSAACNGAGIHREVHALKAVMRFLNQAPWKWASALKLATRAAVGAYAALAGLNAQAADLTNVAAAFGNTVV